MANCACGTVLCKAEQTCNPTGGAGGDGKCDDLTATCDTSVQSLPEVCRCEDCLLYTSDAADE